MNEDRLNTIISYPLSTPTEWYSVLKKKGLGDISEKVFYFNPSIGKGALNYLTFQEGFWLQQMDFTLKKTLPLIQTASKNNELFIITFYLTNAAIKQKTGDTLFDFHFDNISVMLTSSTAVCQYNVPNNEQVKIIQIGFSRVWLLSNVFNKDASSLKELFTSNKPIYLAENLDFEFKYLVRDMDIYKKNRLFLFSSALQLLNIFFSKLEKRQFHESPQINIHHLDFEKLLEVRSYMDESPLEPVSLQWLSQKSGMSLSKFKRLFKQVFGVTPYQYHMQNKMAIAMERLVGKYTVSEVAFLLGYHNLSHFSKAFKKQFGTLPSEVIKA